MTLRRKIVSLTLCLLMLLIATMQYRFYCKAKSVSSSQGWWTIICR
jgi:hypothetical protein